MFHGYVKEPKGIFFFGSVNVLPRWGLKAPRSELDSYKAVFNNYKVGPAAVCFTEPMNYGDTPQAHSHQSWPMWMWQAQWETIPKSSHGFYGRYVYPWNGRFLGPVWAPKPDRRPGAGEAGGKRRHPSKEAESSHWGWGNRVMKLGWVKYSLSGWWFGPFFIFSCIENNLSNLLIFFRGVESHDVYWDPIEPFKW